MYRWRELHVGTDSQLWRSSWNWSCDGLTSVILTVLSTVNLQFQGWLFPLLWCQFSELWLLMSWLQPDHHVRNFTWWGFSLCNTAHSLWLRILSVALEKELKVLGDAYWLNYVLSCLKAFFLHFPTTLIKLILWQKCFYSQEAGGGHGGEGPWGPAWFY